MRWTNWLMVTGLLATVVLAGLTSASADEKKADDKAKEPTADVARHKLEVKNVGNQATQLVN